MIMLDQNEMLNGGEVGRVIGSFSKWNDWILVLLAVDLLWVSQSRPILCLGRPCFSSLWWPSAESRNSQHRNLQERAQLAQKKALRRRLLLTKKSARPTLKKMFEINQLHKHKAGPRAQGLQIPRDKQLQTSKLRHLAMMNPLPGASYHDTIRFCYPSFSSSLSACPWPLPPTRSVP